MHVIIKIKLSVCLLKSSSWPTLVLSLVTHHTLGNVIDLIKHSFNSPTGPDRRVYYACFSPTTEKYPQPEKFSAYTLSISLSWKLQRLSPNTTLLRLQWMNLKHTQEFLCFIFSLKGEKKNLTEKETEWKTHIDGSYPETQLWDSSMFAAWDIDNAQVCVMPQE